LRSVDRAIDIVNSKAFVFFELPIEEGEPILEVAQELSKLGCSTVIDQDRRVIRCFTPDGMPKGFGFL
jgi:hypothetical protein